MDGMVSGLRSELMEDERGKMEKKLWKGGGENNKGRKREGGRSCLYEERRRGKMESNQKINEGKE